RSQPRDVETDPGIGRSRPPLTSTGRTRNGWRACRPMKIEAQSLVLREQQRKVPERNMAPPPLQRRHLRAFSLVAPAARVHRGLVLPDRPVALAADHADECEQELPEQEDDEKGRADHG